MICNIHPAECSKLHCQERYEDLERSRARCAALRTDLDAALQRAEQAERERDEPDTVDLNARGTIERAVIQALRCCINDHGPVTSGTSMSAAKRVIGWLKHYNQQERAKHGFDAQLTALINDRTRLAADLAAALARAEPAERERDGLTAELAEARKWRESTMGVLHRTGAQRDAALARAEKAEADLAAARRERDRLRVLLLAAADWFDAMAQKVGRGQLGEAQKDAEGRAIAYREALEKANG